MKEIELEEFEDYYKQKINAIYAKIKKNVAKLIADMETNLADVRNSLDHFEQAAGDRLGDKALRSLKFFTDRINKDINEIAIPKEDEIYYDNLMELSSSIKKIFTTINETARKSLPKFQKEVQPQIKELNYLTRKLQKKLAIYNEFIRKRYGDVKTAEELLKKIPKLFSLKDNIEHAKKDKTEFENEFEERNKNQQELNKKLLELEKNELFKELKEEREALFQLRIAINDELSFKKALKKLKVGLEKDTINVPGVDINYLRDFLKHPIKLLASDSADLQKFTSLLVRLRHALEENKLNLKTDKKDKTIEHINKIFEEKKLHENIDELKENQVKIKAIKAKIENAGLAGKLEDIKHQISLNTVKLEHLENDKNKKDNDFTRYLASLKQQREEFQKLVKDTIGEDIKINISFSF
ncbi:MAG: hypothetical protein ACFFBP_19505 [Promethearchaeota archaeon]